jgi:hypothetical protein
MSKEEIFIDESHFKTNELFAGSLFVDQSFTTWFRLISNFDEYKKLEYANVEIRKIRVSEIILFEDESVKVLILLLNITNYWSSSVRFSCCLITKNEQGHVILFSIWVTHYLASRSLGHLFAICFHEKKKNKRWIKLNWFYWNYCFMI